MDHTATIHPDLTTANHDAINPHLDLTTVHGELLIVHETLDTRVRTAHITHTTRNTLNVTSTEDDGLHVTITRGQRTSPRNPGLLVMTRDECRAAMRRFIAEHPSPEPYRPDADEA